MDPRLTAILSDLELDASHFERGGLVSHSPIDGAVIGAVTSDSAQSREEKTRASVEAFQKWRQIPAPRRGELVRRLGNALRQYKEPLSALVTLENGKIIEEGRGEVQEMIDICDFAVGLSRQLYGLTIASERPGHHMREYWQPLGPVAIISAFNFPVAVWAWNAAIALVCGNTIVWKPSEKTPLVAAACQAILLKVIHEFGNDAPEGLSSLIQGGRSAGNWLAANKNIPLVSATGSCGMGRALAPVVAGRFGRTILELGGNNAVIVAPSADLDMAIPAIVFGAVGTAGQRCTSTRRIFAHNSIYDALVEKLKRAFSSVKIGNPLDKDTLVGPLIDATAFETMQKRIKDAQTEGHTVFGGERVSGQQKNDAYYVRPALIELDGDKANVMEANVMEETFAPVLNILRYSDLDDAVHRQNNVSQGLSSSIFTNDIREAETFVSAVGSDCGIANVNIGTSGAEIGGAFGGEKETGGGRESGSDAWKAYMRRQTSTVNYSQEMPLAQGIKFDIEN